MGVICVYVPRVSHSCPPPPLQKTLRPASRSGSGSYQISAFALHPGVGEILCVPFKSEISVSPSPVGLPILSPACLQS